MQTLLDWLKAEPFSLGMSSGFFGFFAHTGVISALEDHGLEPTHLAGSSAGALVAGLWGAGLKAQVLRETLVGLQRSAFWDPGVGAGLLRGEAFRDLLEQMLPVKSFEECPLTVSLSVFDVVTCQTRIVHRGPLAEAIQASCSVPLLFQPCRVAGRASLDGGVLDRPGLAGIRPGARLLNHHLSSRSPWRRKNSPALRIEQRPNMTSVVVSGLPRLGPFRLQEGPAAIQIARDAMKRALALPIAALLEV